MTPPPDGLPELPLPDVFGWRDDKAQCIFFADILDIDDPDDGMEHWYTADQMHAIYQKGREDERALPCAAPGWMPIESAPQQRKVYVGYRNKLGNWRTVIAKYYKAETLELSEDADETDDGYAPAGWYEEHENAEVIMLTDEPPELWQPLPPPPEAPK